MAVSCGESVKAFKVFKQNKNEKEETGHDKLLHL